MSKPIFRCVSINDLKPGWAILYVENGVPIPESWRDRFLDELTSPDLEYRKRLEASLRWFGVRWEHEEA